MKRRITISGRDISGTAETVSRVKEQMRLRFRDAEYLDKFIDILARTGWTSLDIDSAVRQNVNTYRPSVQALLFHNEGVLNQLRLTQGTYTHERDTAEDPNYAIRHPGQTELIFRRLTPGDLLMLNAAQRVSAVNGDRDRPSEELPTYWSDIWMQIYHQLRGGKVDPRHMIPGNAAVIGAECLLRVMEMYELRMTFMAGRYYCGVVGRKERTRGEYGFEDVWHFEPTNDEALFKFACVGVCYSIDETAREYMDADYNLRYDFVWHRHFIHVISQNRLKYVMTEEANHGDQETDNHTRPVSPNRLLP